MRERERRSDRGGGLLGLRGMEKGGGQRRGETVVRVGDARARGSVLAATRVVEKDLSEERRDEEERGDFSSGALVADCPLLRTVLHHHHRHRV